LEAAKEIAEQLANARNITYLPGGANVLLAASAGTGNVARRAAN
jgi:hypothetical protein